MSEVRIIANYKFSKIALQAIKHKKLNLDRARKIINTYAIEGYKEYYEKDFKQCNELCDMINSLDNIIENNPPLITYDDFIYECSICLSHIIEEDNDKCYKCNKHFHDGCINQWLDNSYTCPHCRGYWIVKEQRLIREEIKSFMSLGVTDIRRIIERSKYNRNNIILEFYKTINVNK